MIKEAKIKVFVSIAFMVLLLLVVLADEARAGGNHNDVDCFQCVTNHVTEVTEVNEISNWRVSGLSDSDLVEIIGSSLAGGSHQFDWVTTRWQLSITGATQTSDWDEGTSFSFAIGKRFGKDHWMPNALYHLSYTPDIVGDDYVAGGATIPLGAK